MLSAQVWVRDPLDPFLPKQKDLPVAHVSNGRPLVHLQRPHDQSN